MGDLGRRQALPPPDAMEIMATRLSAIDCERHGDQAWSKAVLLKEYFRRAAEYKSVRIAGWRKRASFAPDVLDEIDRAGATVQFGHVLGRSE
jgi:hypothetical protein